MLAGGIASSFLLGAEAGLLEGPSEKQGLLRISPSAGGAPDPVLQEESLLHLQRLQRQSRISVHSSLKCVSLRTLPVVTSIDPKGFFFNQSDI